MELFTPGHLLVLAIVVAILFFGWKQLPDMARSVGRSLRIFKTEIKGMSEDDRVRASAGDEATVTPSSVKPAIEPASEEAAATPPPVEKPSAAATPTSNGTKPADGG
jgi:sec-independent protein translocase protein TatA